MPGIQGCGVGWFAVWSWCSLRGGWVDRRGRGLCPYLSRPLHYARDRVDGPAFGPCFIGVDPASVCVWSAVLAWSGFAVRLVVPSSMAVEVVAGALCFAAVSVVVCHFRFPCVWAVGLGLS